MNIWILEDDFRIAALHADYIHSLKPDAKVRQFLNGTSLVDALRSEQPDILFMDLYIPDVEGYALVQEIRTNFPEIRVVMVTAANAYRDVTTLYSYGVFDYIVKPFDEARLKRTFQKFEQVVKSMEGGTVISQNTLDTLFLPAHSSSGEKEFPKGIDALTLEKVMQLFGGQGHSTLTATEVSGLIGTSRSTARRYLEHLVEEGRVETKLLYGTVGRPERSYVVRETYEQN